MTKTKKDSLFTLRMPSAMRSNLETIATENECSISSVVRYALNNLTNEK